MLWHLFELTRTLRMARISYRVKKAKKKKANNYAQTSLWEALVSLTHKKVIKNKQLSNEFHGALDHSEMELVARLMLQDETVKDAVARLELPAGAELVVEPWMYGTFSRMCADLQ